VLIATKGDNITIHFYNLETTDKHTFTIGVSYNVGEYIVPHHIETLTFKTNQEGIFRFYLLTVD
jgi:hypothetical protein